MAQVPYSPVPEVAPSGQGIRNISVSVPEGAFGENIGRAVGHFGKVLESSSDELFKTAVMLQEQKNQAEAIEAGAKLSDRVSDIHMKFATKEGRAPSDELMDYRGEVDAERKKIRDGLSSDAVRRMYDRDALKTQEIANKQGASHAAAQLKKYTTDQAKAITDRNEQRALANPNDSIADIEAQSVREVENAWKDKLSPEALDVEKRSVSSRLYKTRNMSLADEKPIIAQEMHDKAVAEGKYYGDDARTVQNYITQRMIHVESRNIVHGILADRSLSLEEAEGKVKEATEGFKDPRVRDSAMQMVQTEWRRRDYDTRQAVKANWEDIWEGISAEGGKARTMDELFAQPKSLKAIRALPESERAKIQKRMTEYWKAADKPVNDAEWEALMGMRGQPELRKEWLELVPSEQNISQKQMDKMEKLQKADAKEMGAGNPKVRESIRWIREAYGDQLRALEIHSRQKGVNDKEYDRFEGRMQVWLETYKDQKGKYPDYNTVVNEIGPLVIKNTMGLYKWGGYGPEVKTPEEGFMVRPNVKEKAPLVREVPEEFEKQLRQDLMDKTGQEATKSDIERGYARHLLIEAMKAGKVTGGKKGDKK